MKKYNWKATTNFSNGIYKTISWYINNALWLKHCEKKYKGNRLGKI
jgi:dTDP-D-glucose 4,6-dehydratase